jgi:hypothetical protein
VTDSPHRDLRDDVGQIQRRLAQPRPLVADDHARRQPIVDARVVDGARNSLERDDLCATALQPLNDRERLEMIFPGNGRDRLERGLRDDATGTLGDPRRTWIRFKRRVARDAAEVERLDARRVADSKDRADVEETANIIADDVDRLAGSANTRVACW